MKVALANSGCSQVTKDIVKRQIGYELPLFLCLNLRVKWSYENSNDSGKFITDFRLQFRAAQPGSYIYK